MKNWWLLLKTVRNLKPGQVFGRVFFHLKSPQVEFPKEVSSVNPGKSLLSYPLRKQSQLGPFEFRFLNLQGRPQGWNDETYSQLWIYNLHYFYDLTSENFMERKSWHIELINKWIDENPCGEGNGWTPYPTSLRIVNWIKWHLYTGALEERAQCSLYQQMKFLAQRVEHHLLGNHLFVNGKALYIAGLFFKDEEIIRQGLKILISEVEEQVFDDGSHFELAPMYHALILEDILDVMNFAKTFGHDGIPEGWTDVVKSMTKFLKATTHPDGGYCFFNDSVDGIAPFGGDLLNYARQVIAEPLPDNKAFAVFPQAGFAHFSSGRYDLFFDGGPLGPGHIFSHAHADTGSFELSLGQQRVFVNQGISQYGQDEERVRQRGTASHNTVEVNGENSSEVWQGFRVAKQAKPVAFKCQHSNQAMKMLCIHDGYTRLDRLLFHGRTIIAASDMIEIYDNFSAEKFHSYKGHFHLHPDLKVSLSENFWLVKDGDKVLARMAFIGWRDIEIESYEYHPQFGMTMEGQRLVATYNGLGPFEAATRIELV
jgi:uncharacterized heparinase superfamily protein